VYNPGLLLNTFGIEAVMNSKLEDLLWGQRAKIGYLLFATAVLLLTFLGAREIWTQEHRWADIVSGMFYRGDFLHPYLGQIRYYDKPLLSYWLIAILAKLIGLNMWALRLPSVLAGFLGIWSIYWLGCKLKDKQMGLLAGWMLLTTFYFVFWARTSSADMLNMAGSLFAIAWYMQRREQTGFYDYFVFFLIIALTSLCKGLVGAIVPAIAVLVDLVLRRDWQRHLNIAFFVALILAAVVYFLPFWASSHFGGDAYGQSGLYLVYRENILRYFEPFDHKGPIYTYLIYLPIYTMPWALFLVPALYSLRARWSSLSQDAKWLHWTTLFVFLFFTLSGSRRSYYVLPLVPLTILIIAEWLSNESSSSMRARVWAVWVTIITYVLLFVVLDILPGWYYAKYGVNHFAAVLQADANDTKPWREWEVVMLDAETKLNFYLSLPPNTPYYPIGADARTDQTEATLVAAWPILTNKPTNTIFITRKLYLNLLLPYFAGYHVVQLPAPPALPFVKQQDENAPVAFIPD
jgi:4-amino-4-deoxy-L-arabinose transferase-like glycosyltransferase